MFTQIFEIEKNSVHRSFNKTLALKKLHNMKFYNLGNKTFETDSNKFTFSCLNRYMRNSMEYQKHKN